jgi:serine-type D-Ala-D-Ala carboxypeptidase (penicillin-binding protein 5/6)
LMLNNPLKAPIQKGAQYGTVNIMLDNQVLASRPLIALEDNPRGNMWRRAADTIKFSLHRLFSKSNEKVNTGSL